MSLNSVNIIKTFLKDCSTSAWTAGFTTMLVGVTSSIIIVFQAATVLGANSQEIASWIWALGLTIGLSSIVLSLYYKIPLIAAWSTPGAAYIVLNGGQIHLNEAIGAFILSGLLIAFFGFSSLFKRIIAYIPISITSAMLAGILFPFCLKLIDVYKVNSQLVVAMICAYFISKLVLPKFSILLTLLIGSIVAITQGHIHSTELTFQMTSPVFTMPVFTFHAFWTISIPLFIITMVSQNLVGVLMIKSYGYESPTNQAVGITGIFTALFAPFGAFAANLAAISAALCLSSDAHEDPSKRYVASVVAGFFYILVGVFGVTITAFLFAFPKELVIALASLALLSTLINSLLDAFKHKAHQDPAILTFLVTMSNVSVLGMNSIILGGILGMMLYAVIQFRESKQKIKA